MTITFYPQVTHIKAADKFSAWVHAHKGDETIAAHAGYFQTAELARIAAEELEHTMQKVAKMAAREKDQ